MESPASLAILLILSFGAAGALALLFTRLARTSCSIKNGAALKIRAGSGVYRTRLVSVARNAWQISAPLQRDAYVPLRPGESLILESPFAGGVFLFRSEVMDRDPVSHHISIRPPKEIHRVDRRELKRWPHLQGEAVSVEGEDARVLDISEGGARVEIRADLRKGERVRIELPWGQPLSAWVLSCDGVVTRLRFEELMELPS